MSYKDGIPLLTTFDDDGDDMDDYMMGSVTPRKRCRKRHLLFGIVLCFTVVLVIGLAVSVSLGITLKNGSTEHPGDGGHGTGGTASGGGGGEVSSLVVGSMEMSSTAPVESVSLATSSVDVVILSITISSSIEIGVSSASTAASSISSPSISAPPTSTYSALPTHSPAPFNSASRSLTSTPIAKIPTSSMPPPTPTSSQEAALPSSSMEPSPSLPGTSPSSSGVFPASSPTEMSPSLPGTFPSSSPPEISPSTSRVEPVSTAYEGISSIPTMFPSPTPFPPTQDCSADDTLCPSPNDDRTYLSDTLTNGLRVVVISDPATDLSGASMDVAAGSFNDPSNYTGLAHFCEHMLFLGTHKYPQKNIYSNYLSTHGGYDNAYTSTQETNFHFRVNSAYLEQPLDMFAHFFIDPLLSEDSTASEMYAVNQEHEKNLHSDPWKLWQLLKNVSNPQHPFSQFSTGNFDTLNKSGVNDELRKYYNMNYVAENMFLAVYGRQNTSVLWDWIETSFTSISSNSTSDVPATYNTTPFPANFTGRLIHYYPEASTNTLTLFWQTPPLQGHSRNSVSGFLLRYLGHKGWGSLFYTLQGQGLASAVDAGVEVEADSFQLFTLQITLTESGLDGVSEVVKTVFYYMHLLASMTEEEFLEKWDDYRKVETVNFDYAENESPNDYAVSITSVMRVVTHMADVLPNPRRYQPDYSLTISTAECFTPSNTLIFIGTHRSNDSTPATPTGPTTLPIPIPFLDDVEPIYETPFHNVGIPEELLAYWTYDEAWDQLYSGLFLAGESAFIPQDLTLLPPSSVSEPQRTNGTSSETWVLQDTVLFPQPRVSFTCELRSGCNETSALREALSELFVALVMAKLEPRFFGASEVGYTYYVESSARGLMLTFEGLSDSDIVQHLISDTMGTLVDFNMTDDGLYDLVMSDIYDQLNNYNYTTLPYRYTLYYIQSVVLERPYWTHEEVLDAMQNLTLDNVLHFANTTLFMDVSVSCLAHGNVDAATADMYSQQVMKHLTMLAPPTPSPGFSRTRVPLLPGSDYGLSLPAFNPEDDNSVVNIIFQAGPICEVENGRCSNESVLRSLRLSLLRQVIADECFTQLRTKEKLGYVVFCFSAVRQGVGSFQTVVQSQVYTPEHVLNSTVTFLEAFYHDTVTSSNFTRDFDEKLDVLRQTLTKRDLKLEDKTDRVWTQVLSGQHQFSFRKQQVDLLDSLSAEDFRDFYSSLLLEEGASGRRLIVVVYGKGKEFDLPVKSIIDYQRLNQTSTTLPIQSMDMDT